MEMNFLEQTVQRQQKEIDEVKADQKIHASEISVLKTKTSIHDENIRDIIGDLRDIKDDTKWIRRTLITAVIGFGLTIAGGLIVWYLTQ